MEVLAAMEVSKDDEAIRKRNPQGYRVREGYADTLQKGYAGAEGLS